MTMGIRMFSLPRVTSQEAKPRTHRRFSHPVCIGDGERPEIALSFRTPLSTHPFRRRPKPGELNIFPDPHGDKFPTR